MTEHHRYHLDSERQPGSGLRVVNFPAPPEEMAQLAEAVDKNNGNVFVYVHPLFMEHSRNAPPLLPSYREQVRNSVNTALKDKRPVIIFEEKPRIPTLVSRLDINRSINGNLYVVSTDESTPCPDNWEEFAEQNPGSSEMHLRRLAFASVLNPLREMGVTHAFLGGRFLDFQPPFPYMPSAESLFEEFQWAAQGKPGAEAVVRKGLLPVGCVGAAAQEFVRAGMDISFSGISGPATTIKPMGGF